MYTVTCADCRKVFKSGSNRTERCPKCRPAHDAAKAREWHRANDSKYPYKKARRRSIDDIPMIGDRYAFYWELEREA